MITIIAAMDEDRGIGKGNALPWECPEDMAHFKRTTMGGVIVMGRATADSIGRALPGRRNIVVSRDPGFRMEGVEVANDLILALMGLKDQNVFVIGGAKVFAQVLDADLADRILLTDIPGKFDCDAFFPAFDPGDWAWSAMTSVYPLSPTFNTYTRIRND